VDFDGNHRGQKRVAYEQQQMLTHQEKSFQTYHSPYQVHIDPITGKGPMAIDTSSFSGPKTKYGGRRNSRAFWKQWSNRYVETLNETNLALIKKRQSPIVNDTWIKVFPEHADYMGETLIHHHLDYGVNAIPLPKSLHQDQPGWGIWHFEHNGNLNN
jgi:filamentous hemagglutinin